MKEEELGSLRLLLAIETLTSISFNVSLITDRFVYGQWHLMGTSTSSICMAKSPSSEAIISLRPLVLKTKSSSEETIPGSTWYAVFTGKSYAF